LSELVPGGVDKALDCSTFHEPKTILHKAQKTLMLETDVPEIVNEMLLSVKKGGTCGIIGDYSGFVNGFNIGALMEKGVRFIGCGQGGDFHIPPRLWLIPSFLRSAPVQKYWEEILNDYIITDKFDPTLFVIPLCFSDCSSNPPTV
jgi:threonine dehydrogenase-like Zn-dependent dehydrogenase